MSRIAAGDDDPDTSKAVEPSSAFWIANSASARLYGTKGT